MRSSWKTLVATAVASLLVSPAFATSDEEVQEQLLQMQQRMSQLEDKLQATEDSLGSANERVDAQHQMLEKAGLDSDKSAMSGLSRFLSETDFGGHVAASYLYNTNNPDSGFGPGANTGSFFSANPFHPDHNAFSLDQLWFSMRNEATAESRAGFEAEIVFGKTADALRSNPGSQFAGNSNGSDPYVYTANVSYLAPVSEAGLLLTFGRFETHAGVETADTTENFNITRGLVYSLMQPFNHTGLKVGQTWDMGFEWMVGVSNSAGYTPLGPGLGYGFGSTAAGAGCRGIDNVGGGGAFAPGTTAQGFAQNSDCDDTKTLLWRLAYSPSDSLTLAVNGLWGGDNFLTNGGGNDDDAVGLVDVVLKWDPSERLSTWINFDYLWNNNAGTTAPLGFGSRKTDSLGIAAAGRVGITENTGFALRAEYIMARKVPLCPGGGLIGFDPSGCAGAVPPPFGDGTYTFNTTPDTVDFVTVTGTLDHQLTESLLVRAEVRWEIGKLDKNGNQAFYLNQQPAFTSGTKNWKSNQVLLGVEAIYEF